MRQSWETMTFVSAGHIILTPTQPVGSGRPQRESNPGPPHQEARALPQSYRASKKQERQKGNLNKNIKRLYKIEFHKDIHQSEFVLIYPLFVIMFTGRMSPDFKTGLVDKVLHQLAIC